MPDRAGGLTVARRRGNNVAEDLLDPADNLVSVIEDVPLMDHTLQLPGPNIEADVEV